MLRAAHWTRRAPYGTVKAHQPQVVRFMNSKHTQAARLISVWGQRFTSLLDEHIYFLQNSDFRSVGLSIPLWNHSNQPPLARSKLYWKNFKSPSAGWNYIRQEKHSECEREEYKTTIDIHLIWPFYSSIHPSIIFYHLSGVECQEQQPKQGHPDFPLFFSYLFFLFAMHPVFWID